MAMIPVNRETLGNKRLKPLTSFAFAATTPICEIVASEFAPASASFPIFFVENAGNITPVVLLGLKDGENLFVDANGRWSANYLPAALRRYPFTLGQGDNGAAALMLDDASGLLSDSEGEPLFGTEGQNDSETLVGRVIQLISQADYERGLTRQALAKLGAAGLFQPVTMTVKQGEGERSMAGLLVVDEQKFNALSDEAFLDLRKAGTLPLVYAHLLSLAQVSQLQNRQNARTA